MENGNQNFMPQIQVLRGFAAICVVLTHVFLGAGWMRLEAGLTTHPHIGEFGVDVFFVISGFLMVVVSKDDFGKNGAQWNFLIKRLKRIFPLYWLLTMILIAVVIVAPQLIAFPTIDIVYWVKSLLLIPSSHPVEAGIRPLLVVGWTLQYEMFFYGLFAVSMFFSRRTGLLMLFAILIAFSSIEFFGEPQNILLAFYGKSIVLEFAAGMCLALLYINGFRLRYQFMWILPAVALILLATGWWVSSDVDINRVIYFGVPATLLMAGLTLPKGVNKLSFGTLWLALGNSSYALYLSHVFVVAVMSVLFSSLGSSAWQQQLSSGIVYIIVSLVVSCVVGWVLHRVIELPVAAMLRSKPGKSTALRHSGKSMMFSMGKST